MTSSALLAMIVITRSNRQRDEQILPDPITQTVRRAGMHLCGIAS